MKGTRTMARTPARTLMLAGLALLATGLAVFLWYNTIVLDSDEIARLESGGQSTSGLVDLGALIASPVLVLAGISLLVLAWTRHRGRTH